MTALADRQKHVSDDELAAIVAQVIETHVARRGARTVARARADTVSSRVGYGLALRQSLLALLVTASAPKWWRPVVERPPDAVGPEVVRPRPVSDRAARTRSALRRSRRGGAALPSSRRHSCRLSGRATPVLLGAVGDPAFDHLPRAEKIETGLLALRQGAMGVYANLRPARAWAALDAVVPFKPERMAGADLLIVRELLGRALFRRAARAWPPTAVRREHHALHAGRGRARRRASPSTSRAARAARCCRWTRPTCSRRRSSGARR